MINGQVEKTPGEQLDYGVDWLANGVLQSGETITTSTWSVQSGLTQPLPPSNTSTTTTVWLGGGTVGYAYEVTNTITTSGARIWSRTFTLTVVATLSN